MSALADLPLIASGKVRELYDLGDRLLLVATDRISTYDAIHPTPIPDKGKVLTGLSVFWFEQLGDIVPNHLVSATEACRTRCAGARSSSRSSTMLPVECVVRGYITGSGWKDYQATGKVSGLELPPGPAGVRAAAEPIYTPSTKAEVGHDEAIDFEQTVDLLGGDRALAEQVRDVSIELYANAAEHARSRGVILADTKFELGRDADGDAHARRRGADARLLALLARRRLRGRPRSAELRQAVRARLGVRHRLGQEAAGAADPRRRRRRARARSTSRRTS